MNNVYSTPRVIAHRGCGSLGSENSMEGIVKAVGKGVRGIEIDIHVSQDGVPFVHHNTALVDGRRIMDLHSKDVPQSVPPLYAIVDYCMLMKVWIDADVKFESDRLEHGAAWRAISCGRVVAETLLKRRIPRTAWMPPHMISSFNVDVLNGARGAMPDPNDLIVAQIMYKPLGSSTLANIVVPAQLVGHPHFDSWARRLNVWAWGDVASQEEASTLFRAGVIGIITSRPDIL